MHCLRLDKNNHRVIYSVSDLPRIQNDNELIIKVKIAGLCGTDLHIIEDKFQAIDGVALGHEMAGYVHEVPQKCVKFKVGDRVVLNPNISCTECAYCQKGLYNYCQKGGLLYTLGISIDGGFAEYCKANMSLVFKISDNITYEQAVLCEPLSCIVHALDKLSRIEIGSNILVIGAGIIGLLWCSVLHVLGHRKVFISEPNVGRQKTLNDLGLEFHCMEWEKILQHQKNVPKWKVDLCIDCSGNTNAIQAAIPLLQYGGTLLIFGVANPAKTIEISPFEMYKKELVIRGSVINTHTSFHKAVALLESLGHKYLTMEKLAMKKFSLNEYNEALDTFRKGTYTKIVFEI